MDESENLQGWLIAADDSSQPATSVSLLRNSPILSHKGHGDH